MSAPLPRPIATPTTVAEILVEIRRLYPHWQDPGITAQIAALSTQVRALTPEVEEVAAPHPAPRTGRRRLLRGATLYPYRPYLRRSW
jgi:hypothetical protein